MTIHYTYIHTPKVYQVQESTEPLLLAHIIHQIAAQANLTSDILGQTCFSSFHFFFVSHKDFFFGRGQGQYHACEKGKQSVGCLGQWFSDSSSSFCCFSSTADNGTRGFSGFSPTHTYTHRKKNNMSDREFYPSSLWPLQSLKVLRQQHDTANLLFLVALQCVH